MVGSTPARLTMVGTRTLEAFTYRVLDVGDLDPVCSALLKNENAMSPDQWLRWMLAYWLFFHPGLASYLSEHSYDDFWGLLEKAAENSAVSPIGGRWPRGMERRHFRGATAIMAVNGLMTNYVCPEEFLRGLLLQSTHEQELKWLKSHYAFGEWLCFRAVNQLHHLKKEERSGALGSEALKFNQVVRAAMKHWDLRFPADRKTTKESRVLKTIDHVMGLDESIGAGDAILLLGRWASFLTGSYKVGDLLIDAKADLAEWAGVSETSKLLFDTLHANHP